MRAHPLRLCPGDDLRGALEDMVRQGQVSAAFVMQGIGSLSVAQLRFAGNESPAELRDDLEVLTLAGTLSADGAHLHMSVADSRGRVFGGHVAHGCLVRTTAEILLAILPEHRFSREYDARSGFAELAIQRNYHWSKGRPRRTRNAGDDKD
ncbi:PPC domain-containing DNA-binding protein [Cupriavidus pinatubonensis]|uniref:PPC domain-containing DNA-binding protein n=1 Tax=Cupriavidus pinatubonensis TaxID=248026 RepID=UPI00361C127A